MWSIWITYMEFACVGSVLKYSYITRMRITTTWKFSYFIYCTKNIFHDNILHYSDTKRTEHNSTLCRREKKNKTIQNEIRKL